MTYRKKIFLYFLFIFIVFTIIVIFLQLNREKEYKVSRLRTNLDTYTDLIYKYTENNQIDSTASVLGLLPDNIRLTVVEQNGDVRFDNTLNSDQERKLESHLYRPEITSAKKNGTGFSIRYSQTNKIDYYYYAKYFPPLFIRVAIPYDLTLQESLKADKYFLYFIFILFLSLSLILLYASDKLGRAISGLSEFLSSVEKKNPEFDKIKFPDTEIGKIGEKIVKTYSLLERRNKELDDEREKNRLIKHEMTSNIAHELRTPVSTISGYVETLLNQENIDVERQKYYLKRMDIQTKRLADLIRDIALITKTEEAPNLFIKEDISISNTIEEVVSDFSVQIDANKIKFNSNVSEGVLINGNHTLIYSIFRNLIENAINYGGKGSTISVDNYAEDKDFYYFKVSDTGIGVAEEHLSKLFDRFYRVSYGRSRKSGGSGLGLSIVKNAIKFHGGEISAKSKPTGGLEFRFYLNRCNVNADSSCDM